MTHGNHDEPFQNIARGSDAPAQPSSFIELPPPGTAVAAGHPGLVDAHEAAAIAGVHFVRFHEIHREGEHVLRVWRQPGGGGRKRVLFAREDVERLRDALAWQKRPFDGPADAPLPREGATVPVGYPGLMTKKEATAMLGMAGRTFNEWQNRAGFKLRRWKQYASVNQKPALFAREDVLRLGKEIEAHYAPYSGPMDAPLPEPESVVPAGYPGLVTQREAAAMFGISFGRWINWQQDGVTPTRRWYEHSPIGQRTVLFATGDLEEMRTRLDVYHGPYTGPMNAPLPPPGTTVQKGYPGLLTREEAASFIEVPFTTWKHWERSESRQVPERQWWQRQRNSGRPVLYAMEDLVVMKEELRKRLQPYPDPTRPNCYRVPIRSYLHDMEALIDAEDLPLVQGRNWNWSPIDEKYSKSGCVILAAVQRTATPLRRIVLGLEAHQDRKISHLNLDPLDCRKSNLIVRSLEQVSRSCRKMRTRSGQECSSQYKGVCWCAERSKWLAQIRKGNVHRHVGRFDSEIEAARAYDREAHRLFGIHARLNFPEELEAPPAPPGAPLDYGAGQEAIALYDAVMPLRRAAG